MINVPQKAAERLSIEKEGIINDTKNSKAMLITTINKPKVKTISGNEISFIKGLTNALATPNKTPTLSKFIIVKSRFSPSTSLTAIKIAKALLKIWRIIFIINFINFLDN
jgi:hypothetical protein